MGKLISRAPDCQGMAFMRKSVVALIAFSLGIPFTLLGHATPAFAASCYAASCTGHSAGSEGCSADAVTAEQAYIYDDRQTNVVVGIIQLRYSPTCRSTWAKVIGYVDDTGYRTWGGATIVSTSNSIPPYNCTADTYNSTYGGWACQTVMIDDLNPLKSWADGNAPTYDHSSSFADTSPAF